MPNNYKLFQYDLINNVNFGLLIKPEVFGTSSNDAIAYVDSVELNVYYSVPIKNITFNEFGFNIPTDAIITGVELSIDRKSDLPNVIVDEEVYLLSDVGSTSSIISDNLSSTAIWSDMTETVTYGSFDNDWGISWTPSLLNSSKIC